MGLILLRMLSLATGFAMLVLPPMMVAADGLLRPGSERTTMMLASMALGSLGFFLIGLCGNQMDRSPWLRHAAAALLTMPLITGALWLWASSAPAVLLAGALLLVFTMLMGLTLVYPVIPFERHRPMRLRD